MHLAFSALLLLNACTEKSPPPPSGLLSEDQMVEVMTDMHLVETANNLKLMGTDTAYTEYLQAFNAIFRSHGVTKAQFDSSLYHYTVNTEKMPIIYDRMLERMYELEEEVRADP